MTWGPRWLPPTWRRVATWSVATLGFALAYGQFPLSQGNYNTYLLHGFAAGGRGLLEFDWLARTIDPFPVFSALITIPAALDWRWFFYVAHGALLGVYLYSSMRLVEGAYGQNGPISRVILLSVLALPQVWLGRDAVSYVFNGDWAWCVQSGVAMQYVVGHMFQPSLFGVLCVASIAAFVHRRDWMAPLLAAAALLMHFGYLITVLGMMVSYSLIRWREAGNARAALRYAACTLTLCAVASLPALRFLPTDEATAAEAARILTEIRFPHHALPSRWLGHPSIVWVQGPLLALGALVAWHTRVRWVFLILLGLGSVLLLTQVVTGSRQLALLFPWRASVVLVPVAFSLMIGALSRRLWARQTPRHAVVLGAAVALVAAGYGYSHTRAEVRSSDEDPIVSLLSAASAMATPQTVFAIPTDMERFRLEAGAPTFVDFKAHPYKDAEVVEWHARISLARELDGDEPLRVCDAVARLHDRYGVTHFVRPTSHQLVCDRLVTAFRDEDFLIQQWL